MPATASAAQKRPSDPLCATFSVSNLTISCPDQVTCSSTETCASQDVSVQGLIVDGVEVPICVCVGPTFPAFCIINPALQGVDFGTVLWSGPPCACEAVPTLPEWGSIAMIALFGIGGIAFLKRGRRGDVAVA